MNRSKNLNFHQLKAPPQGFSLIEVLITVFLIGALGVILVSTSNSLSTRRRTNLRQLAAKMMSRDIEHMRNLAFSSLPQTTVGTCENPSTLATDIKNDLALLKNSCFKRINAAYEGPDIRLMTVSVTWSNDAGGQENAFIDTLIYKDGI